VFHKFVILLNLRSLFWPRLEPAYENSGYQRCLTFLSSAVRITFEDATISKPSFVAQSTPNRDTDFKLFRHEPSSFSAICEDRSYANLSPHSPRLSIRSGSSRHSLPGPGNCRSSPAANPVSL